MSVPSLFQIQRLVSDFVGKSLPCSLISLDNSSGGQFEILCAQGFGASLHDHQLLNYLYPDTQDLKSTLDVLMENSFALRCKLTIQIK